MSIPSSKAVCMSTLPVARGAGQGSGPVNRGAVSRTTLPSGITTNDRRRFRQLGQRGEPSAHSLDLRQRLLALERQERLLEGRARFVVASGKLEHLAERGERLTALLVPIGRFDDRHRFARQALRLAEFAT